MKSSNPLFVILDQHRLTGPNFIDWLRNLKVVLASERILYVLNQSPPATLPNEASQEEHITLEQWNDDDLQARCIMWASMSTKIHRQYEKYTSIREILLHVQNLFG